MGKVLVFLLLAFALTESFRTKRGITELGNGDSCTANSQCKTGCCERPFGQNKAQCAARTTENQECSPKPIYRKYYKCPCESGLTCVPKASLLGLPGDFGTCHAS